MERQHQSRTFVWFTFNAAVLTTLLAVGAGRGIAQKPATTISDATAMQSSEAQAWTGWGRQEKEWCQIIRAYCASISFMDAQTGVVLDALDRLKVWDHCGRFPQPLWFWFEPQ